jgi:hypothetical protein
VLSIIDTIQLQHNKTRILVLALRYYRKPKPDLCLPDLVGCYQGGLWSRYMAVGEDLSLEPIKNNQNLNWMEKRRMKMLKY